MILNMTGGGGTSLNFKVVNYATEAALLAATPPENTIGVITDVPIPGYYFCNEEPSPAAAGEVWITIGTSSRTAFNALKKNCIQVYPISAKQYLGGVWVDKTAKSYQGGEWADWWNGELYSPGNEWVNITGGWTSVAQRGASGSYNYQLAALTITKGDNYMDVTGTGHGIARPNNLIDLTNYSKITLKYAASTNGDWTIFSVVERGGYWTEGVVVGWINKNGLDNIQECVLDVSEVSGEYDVAIGIGQKEATIRVYEIKME